MAYRKILVHLDAGSQPAPNADYCVRLARAMDAKLEAVAIVPPLRLPQSLRSRRPARELLERELRRALKDASGAAQAFAAAVRSAGGATVGASVVEADPLEALESRSRYFDLLVLGPPDADDLGALGGHFVEEAIVRTGRPVLVLPRRVAAQVPPREAVVAWNDGRECWRAVGGALPLLALSETVTLVSVAERGRASGDMTEALAYLDEHGVRARAVVLRGAPVAARILQRAERADLLVMGAFGSRSRLAELVLGGSTREVLEKLPVPVLMSH